jgi:hypothetical protein
MPRDFVPRALLLPLKEAARLGRPPAYLVCGIAGVFDKMAKNAAKM